MPFYEGNNKNREPFDFYPTPPYATNLLLENVDFYGNVLEPASGDGAISKILEERGYGVTSFDIQEEDFIYGRKGVDFLSYDKDENYDNVITNPPYSLIEDFIKKSLEISSKKVAVLSRLNFLSSQSRFRLFKEERPYKILVLCKRLPWYNKKTQQMESGAFSHCWIVWDKENKNKETIIDWVL